MKDKQEPKQYSVSMSEEDLRSVVEILSMHTLPAELKKHVHDWGYALKIKEYYGDGTPYVPKPPTVNEPASIAAMIGGALLIIIVYFGELLFPLFRHLTQ